MRHDTGRTVAMWKNAWLPFSETFIRDQVYSMREWDVLKLGFENVSHGLLPADFAPYGQSLPEKAVRRIFGVHPFLRSYTRVIEERQSALIHAHFGSGGINSLPLARATGLPLITTFHGADTSFYGSRFPGVENRYRAGLRHLFQRGHLFIAASKYLADRLVAAGAPAAKVEVVYTGTKSVELLHVPTRSGVVFVGRLIAIKGVSHLFRAVAELGDPYAGTPITIIGDGPLRKELETLARRLDVNAKFLGRVPSAELPKILASHQIFCGPSLPSPRNTREGFGMVYLEAALQELPTVAYSSGGVTEAVAHGVSGLLAPEGDVQRLSKALKCLLKDETLRAELGKAGRRRVLSEFSLDIQTAHLEELYLGASTM